MDQSSNSQLTHYQNILVVEKRPEHRKWWVKIGDFGISKRILEDSGTSLHTVIGTRPYCAPEVLGYLKEYQQTSVYSNKVDIWSLGCVLFNIGTRGHLTFSEANLVRYCDGTSPFNVQGRVFYLEDQAVSLVKWLLHPDPEHRPNAADALQYRWLATDLDTPALEVSYDSSETPLSYGVPHEAQPAKLQERNYNSFLQSTLSKQAETETYHTRTEPHTVPSATPLHTGPERQDLSSSIEQGVEDQVMTSSKVVLPEPYRVPLPVKTTDALTVIDPGLIQKLGLDESKRQIQVYVDNDALVYDLSLPPLYLSKVLNIKPR